MKQLWFNIINWINELGTPAVKLLVGGSFLIIVVLWLGLKDNYGDLKERIHLLEDEVIKTESAKETQRILMQDKIDQCGEEKYKNLKEMLDQSEKLKKAVKSIK